MSIRAAGASRITCGWGGALTAVVAALLLLAPSAARASETLVWAGVDYGLVRMIGTGDFREPDAIFPGYLDKWNVLVLQEQLPKIERRLRQPVVTKVSHLTELHRQADATTQIVREDLITVNETHLSEAHIQERLRAYPDLGDGVGLVFIADQLNKPQQQGCFWVTYFDLSDHELISTQRHCGNASGFGFRNYWFGTVKRTIRQLHWRQLP